MAGELITLNSMGNGDPEPVYFGSSPVELRQLAEGSLHKSARKEHRKMMDLLSPVFAVQVGGGYLYHSKTGGVFLQTDFPDGQQFYLGLRSSNLDTLDPEKDIQFVGGMCIGGSSAVSGIDHEGIAHNLLESDMPKELGEPIKELRYDPQITAYETDTIRKLMNVIGSLKASLKNRASSQVSFHVPAPEYLLYGLQYLEKGVLDLAQVDAFDEAVMSRGAVLTDRVKKRLAKLIGPENVRVGSPLDCLRDIPTATLMGMGLQNVCERLGEEDVLWKKIIETAHPTSWTDLANCSYSYFYLHHTQQSDGMNIIGVENPEEMSILLASKKIATDTGLPLSMACVYPHSHVFTTTGDTKRLYRHGATSMRELVTIAKQYSII